MRTQARSWRTLFSKLGFSCKKGSYCKAPFSIGSRKLRFENFESRQMLTTFTVNVDYDTNTFDEFDSVVTLREAIFEANDTPGLDTILFDSTLDGETITLGIDEFGGNLNLGSAGELNITEEVTIDATMLSGGLTVDASGNDNDVNLDNGGGSSVFDIRPRSNSGFDIEITLRGLILTGADTFSGGGAVSFDDADNSNTNGVGKLKIEDSIIRDNYTFRTGAAVNAEARFGTLDITRSMILNNTAGSDGGGVSLKNIASATITGTDFVNNEAANRGGGLFVDFGYSTFQSQEITITGSEFIGNRALGTDSIDGGGGVYADLAGSVNASSNNLPIFRLEDSTIEGNNHAENDGGGLWVCTKYGGTFEVRNSTISGNTAGREETFGQDTFTYGGDGGGLFIGMPPWAAVGTWNPSFANVTISGNTGLSRGGGAWVGVVDTGNMDPNTGELSAEFINVTITDNNSPEGGGLFSDPDLAGLVQTISTTLSNTIVSGNFVSATDSTASNVGGEIELVTSTYNLLGSNAGSFSGLPPTSNSNIHDDDPKLGPLASHGGLTQTHAPLVGSPAIDAGSNGLAAGLSTDQRGTGFPRIYNVPGVGGAPGPVVDIGAYEVGLLKVINVIVSGSGSVHAPFSFDTVDGSGDQLRTVPVGAADTISVVFSEDVDAASIDKNSLRVLGLTTANLPTVVDAAFNYDSMSDTATWQFEDWTIYGDNYLISLTDAVSDIYGSSLDGEWMNPASMFTVDSLVSEFPSGDGVVGGDFEFVMTLLPGDADLSGHVSTDDLSILLTNHNILVDQLFVDADFNGDGAVTTGDLSWLLLTFGENLQDIFVLADLDGDLVVDLSNWLTIQGNLGMTGATYEDGDLDGDGTVTQDDLDVALAQLSFGVNFDWVA